MIFLGYDFLNNYQTTSITGGDPSVSSIGITNGIYDSAYLSSDTEEFNTPETSWKESTLLFATFDNQDLNGSNFEYSSELYSIQLRRREIGKPWILLYEQIIKDANDINFVYKDNFARGSETEYEYALIPILKNGTELPYIKSTIVSDFFGAVIADGLQSYHILLDSAVTETVRNHQMSVVTTLNSKYPYVISCSESNYTHGSFSGTVIKYTGNDVFDIKHSHWYREDFVNWLTNGEPKILKLEDGREWMVVVSSDISDSRSEHVDKATLQFDFDEVGDFNNSDHMYNNGLTNVTIESVVEDTHTITNNLLYVTTNNNAISIQDGDSYSSKLTPAEDYEISGAIVMLGGVNITTTTYNKKTHEINVPSVTANLTITSSATRIRIPVEEIIFTEKDIFVYVGNSHTLKPTVKPAGADISNLNWSSENEKIATVTNGTVVGVSVGKTKITAYADGKTASISVTVRR